MAQFDIWGISGATAQESTTTVRTFDVFAMYQTCIFDKVKCCTLSSSSSLFEQRNGLSLGPLKTKITHT